MKNLINFVLVLMIVLSSSLVFANPAMESKLEGHWSKGMIDKDFVALYFPYLARNNFEKLNPNENILKKDLAVSLGSLLKDYSIDPMINNMVSNDPMKRIDIASIIGGKLSAAGIGKKTGDIPFKDLAGVSGKDLESIKLLYNANIISGVSRDRFAPDRAVSKAEAILILQRVKGVLGETRDIPFEIKGAVQSYNSSENIVVKEKDTTVLVTITKQFSTPGYALGVDKIIKDGRNYKILLDIDEPAKGTILPQVITYKTITIEIAKSNLKTSPTYKFIVDGIESSLVQ